MSQGWPVLVGAGCLALGYVYGRLCRAAREIPPDEPAATDQDACCAQSQSNTYLEDLEPCKCCMSAPAELDTGKRKGSKFPTRSPFMIRDAAEGFKHAERSGKRDLEHLVSVDLCGRHMDDEAYEICSSPYFEKSNQMLEDEQVLQAKTPSKKQKWTSPAVKESFCSKGKAEMSREEEDAAVESVAWSQEVLKKRIEYFNNATSVSATSGTGRSDESRKLRDFKENFLKARAAEGEATYNSASTSSHKSGGADRSTCGLVPLATPDHDDNSPNSPHRECGGGVPQLVQDSTLKLRLSEAGPETFSIMSHLHSGNDHLEERSKDAVRDAGAVTIGEKVVLNELESSSMQAEVLQTDPSPPQIPENDHDRCSEGMELKKVVPVDEGLKVEIYGLLNEAECSKVSSQGVVSLLEKRLQTDLQDSKVHIATLVHEIASTSKLLEEEGLPAEANKATDIHKALSSCCRLSKSPVLSKSE